MKLRKKKESGLSSNPTSGQKFLAQTQNCMTEEKDLNPITPTAYFDTTCQLQEAVRSLSGPSVSNFRYGGDLPGIRCKNRGSTAE